MQKQLIEKMLKTLNEEFKKVDEGNDPTEVKFEKIIDISNMIKVLENFDELEPVIAVVLNKKAKKERFDRER